MVLIKGILCGISFFLNLLPRGFVNSLGSFLGWFLGSVIRFRRSTIQSNLKEAFKEKDESQIEKLTNANYRHYGKGLLDFLKSLTWTQETFRKHVPVVGLEKLEPFLKSGKGFYFLTLHIGAWELALASMASHDVPVVAVVKQGGSRLARDFMYWYRRKTGAKVLFESRTSLDILKAIDNGTAVACLLDQFMGPPIGVPVTFFGKTAGTAASLALLLERKPVPVVVAYCVREEEKLVLNVEDPLLFEGLGSDRTNRLYERTQTFNDAMEKVIRKYPEQWLWLHRRWKPFKGESRWKQLVATTASLLFLLSCASQKPSETGIVVPPDPQVAAPPAFAKPETVTEEAPPSAASFPVIQPAKKEKLTQKKPEPQKPKEPAVKPLLELGPLPFAVGERMVIDLVWMSLPAGRVVMEVRKNEPVGGREVLNLWGNVLSSKLVDAIYHVDNTIESQVDAKALVPYKFLLHMVEASQKKETKVVFDQGQGKAHYWSSRVSKRWGDEVIQKTDDVPLPTRDMYSGLYYIRTMNYRMNEKLQYSLYEKSKSFDILVTPIAQEVLNTKVGVFQCWKLKVQVSLNNNLQQTGDSYLWISDDSSRFLVKFEAKIKIGALVGTLVELRERG